MRWTDRGGIVMFTKRMVSGAAALAIALAGAGWMYGESGKSAKLTASDYVEIQQLYATYAQSLDLGDAEGLAGVFTDDGELIGSRGAGQTNAPISSFKGRAALLEMERSHGNFGSRHFTSNLVLRPAADGVRATCYMTDIIVRNVPAKVAFTGVFDGTVVKTSGGWKFRKLTWWRDGDDVTPSPYRATAAADAGAFVGEAASIWRSLCRG
jgi:hypothetical protein